MEKPKLVLAPMGKVPLLVAFVVALASMAVLLLPSCNIFAPRKATANPGSWSATDSMVDARAGATATTLESGTAVLMAGGSSGSGLYLASAERYETETDSWVPAGMMGTSRASHAATELQNGQVLVAGGRNTSGVLDSVELYDPLVNAWPTAASLTFARSNHGITLLNNGKVLVTGGTTTNGGTAAVELYDPLSDTWTGPPPLTTARSDHTATLLPNGTVLVAGGFASDGSTLVVGAELYDPKTDAWSPAGILNSSRAQHSATLLTDGRVLAVGGKTANGATAGAEVYDPDSNNWTPVDNLASPRYDHGAVRLPNGAVLVPGGKDGVGTLADVELYDPFTDNWSSAGVMGLSRHAFEPALLSNGKVLVAGGLSSTVELASAELYDPGSWSAASTLLTATPRLDHTATLLTDGKVLVVGGQTSGAVAASAVLYDPATRTWSAAGTMSTPRKWHTATRLADGRVFVTGGHDGTSYLSSADVYDPGLNSWAPAGGGGMSVGRAHHTATLVRVPASLSELPPGKVLVLGGENGNGVTDSAEAYDVAMSSWSTALSLPAPRAEHTATLIPAASLTVVAGGRGALGALNTAVVYNARTNMWSPPITMGGARMKHEAVRLIDGRVLVAGGSDGIATRVDAELYDPRFPNTWSPAGTMSIARQSFAMAPLTTGQVLAMGGSNGAGTLSTAELYDPLANGWSPTQSMTAVRAGHTAVLLHDGSALVAGGSLTVGGAERYGSYLSLDTPGPDFIFPMDCVLNVECFYVNYVDNDRTNAILDWACLSRSYDGHSGTDITLPDFSFMDQGIDVYASDGGIVVATVDGNMDRNTMPDPTAISNQVVIVHPSGLATIYLHLRLNSIGVRTGELVARGQKIAQVGSSGSSTAPHLHFAVVDFGLNVVDPWKNPVGVNCGGEPSLWQTQHPYLNYFVLLTDYLLAKQPSGANGPVQGPPSIAALPPSASQVCYGVTFLSISAGDTTEIRFVGPGSVTAAALPPQPRTQGPPSRHSNVTACANASAIQAHTGTWTAEFRHNGTLMSSREFTVCVGTCLSGVHQALYSNMTSLVNNCTVEVAQSGDGSGPNGLTGTMDCTTAHDGTFVGTLDQTPTPKTVNLTVNFSQPILTVESSGTIGNDGDSGSGVWDCVPTCIGGSYSSSLQPSNRFWLVQDQVGAVITTALGDELRIPAASMGGDTGISLDIVPLPFPPPSGVNVISRGYRIGPSGTTFTPPALLVLRYSDADLAGGIDPAQLRVMVFDSTQTGGGAWVLVGPSTVDEQAQTITVEITHLSEFAVFDCLTGLSDSDGDGIGDACEGSGVGGIVELPDAATSTPLVAQSPSGLSARQIAAIAVGSVLGALALAGVGRYAVRRW